MPRAKKNASSSATISKSSIDQVTQTLQNLPEKPKENWSLREAVAQLQEQISAALNKGYSYDEVAQMLTQQGVEISASSLKSYLSVARRQKGAATSAKTEKTGRKSRKTASQSNGADQSLAAAAQAISEAETLNRTQLSLATEEVDTTSNNGNGKGLVEQLTTARSANTGETKRRTRSTGNRQATSEKRAKTAAKSKTTGRAKSAAKGKSEPEAPKQRRTRTKKADKS